MDVPALHERPALSPHLYLFWSGFWLASPARAMGMGGVGGIPLTEIEAVMRLQRIEDWSAQVDFVRVLKGMDHAYLDYHAAQHEADQQAQDRKRVSN